MKNIVVIFLLPLVGFWACGPELSPEEAMVKKLKQDLEVQPSAERAEAYLDGVIDFVSKNSESYSIIEPYLKEAIQIADQYELDHRKAGFIVPLLRKSSDVGERRKYLLQLGDVMQNMGKRHASSVIFKELLRQFPDDSEVLVKSVLIDSSARDTSDYVAYLFNRLLVNPDNFGVNRAAAIRFIDAAEAFALSNPMDSLVPKFLYSAAEVARHQRDLNKALNLYDWVLESYPAHPLAPNVLFIKGFIIEQDLKQTEEARLIYQEFLDKYPDHEMASSAKFLLDNLGKSEQEILEMIESKRSQDTDSTGLEN